MTELERVRAVAVAIADAIARKDANAIVGHLAPGFLHRSPGGEARDSASFAQAIREIPGEDPLRSAGRRRDRHFGSGCAGERHPARAGTDRWGEHRRPSGVCRLVRAAPG